MLQHSTFREATLTSFTGRTETHGKEFVPAISLGLLFEAAPNTELDQLSETLLDTLYMPVPGQAQLPGVEITKPLLRCKDFGTISLDAISYEGWTVHIEHGFNGFITVLLAKIDGFKVTPYEGGPVDIACRIGSSKIDQDDVGTLWTKQKQKVRVMFVAPAKDSGPVIDGSTEAFERDHPGQQTMELDDADIPGAKSVERTFAEQHGGH